MSPKRISVGGLLGAVALALFAGCHGVAGPNERIEHTLAFSVDDSAGDLKNVTYKYGGNLLDGTRPSALAGMPIESHGASMTIPDTFDASWETADGKSHTVSVPIRGKLTESVEGKTIQFVFRYDTVDVYLAERVGRELVRLRRIN